MLSLSVLIDEASGAAGPFGFSTLDYARLGFRVWGFAYHLCSAFWGSGCWNSGCKVLCRRALCMVFRLP